MCSNISQQVRPQSQFSLEVRFHSPRSNTVKHPSLFSYLLNRLRGKRRLGKGMHTTWRRAGGQTSRRQGSLAFESWKTGARLHKASKLRHISREVSPIEFEKWRMPIKPDDYLPDVCTLICSIPPPTRTIVQTFSPTAMLTKYSIVLCSL